MQEWVTVRRTACVCVCVWEGQRKRDRGMEIATYARRGRIIKDRYTKKAFTIMPPHNNPNQNIPC